MEKIKYKFGDYGIWHKSESEDGPAKDIPAAVLEHINSGVLYIYTFNLNAKCLTDRVVSIFPGDFSLVVRDKRKNKNECQFCKSRSCYKQIYRDEFPFYDEVYCDQHCNEAEEESNRVLGGAGSKVFRTYRSSTGKLRRGDR